jgi:hypothetical protein
MNLPSGFLDQQVLPRLFERLDHAFPEMGWMRKGTSWIATNEQWSRKEHNCRADRVTCYDNSRHCYVIHGQADGNVTWVSYVMGGGAPRGRDFITAIARLAEKVGLKLPENDEPERAKRLSAEWSRRLVAALHENAAAIVWLTKTRGWSHEVIERFQLGLTIKEQGSAGEKYNNALTFPHISSDGKAIGHYYVTDIPGVTVFEKLDDHRRGSTWGRRMPDKPLYYGSTIDGKKNVLLVEGFKDLFAVSTLIEGDELAKNLLVVTATHGAGSVVTTQELRSPAFWGKFERIYLGLDNDDAGQRAIDSLLPSIPKEAMIALVPDKCAVKEGKRADWNDLLLNGGLEAFKAVLAEAKPKSSQVGASKDYATFDEIDINVAFHDGYLYWPFEMPERIAVQGKLQEEFRTFVLRSDGLQLDMVEHPRITNRGRAIKRLTDGTPIISAPKPVRSSKTSWHWSSIQAFCNQVRNKGLNRNPQASLGELIGKIYKHLRAAVWLPYREDYATITLGIVTSYCQEIFEAVPLFMLIGERGSGKTELGKNAAALGCNGVALGRTTVAGLMEACDRYRGLVAVDDFEEIGVRARGGADTAINDMAQVIKQSYKKTGGTHTRVGDGNLTERNLFGVKFLNNTLGADPITLSRMFSIRTRKMTDETKKEMQQFAGDLMTSVQINELRNKIHVWIYSHVPEIVHLATELKKDKVNRDDEIALPLRVLGCLADLTYLSADLEVAIARRINASNCQEDEESALREALRALVVEGHEFVSVHQVMNEMVSLLGNTWGAESKSDLPEWQRPKALSKKLVGFWLDESQMVRKRIEHKEIVSFRPRFYRILDDRRAELLGELSKEGAPPMVQPRRHPGDFCSGCAACKYREKCFIRQEYGRQTGNADN